MANEKRLIDAIPLMQNGWHLVQTGESNRFLASKSLADVPTVDAVEVVRCKDCLYWKQKGLCPMYGYNGESFCSYGERKKK